MEIVVAALVAAAAVGVVVASVEVGGGVGAAAEWLLRQVFSTQI